jgi:hypothetical protein
MPIKGKKKNAKNGNEDLKYNDKISFFNFIKEF